jgi:ATP-dependent RNA helicase DeaD
MTDRFEDLGISPELSASVESLGWDTPAGLQRDALPVIRRGNNVVLHASAGSGVVGAYGLGILDQLALADAEDDSEESTRPRALVLVPDADSASRTADSLARMAAPAGLSVRAHGAGWSQRPVDLLVLSPTAAAAAVRESALKVDGIRSLVIDGADVIEATGQWDDLETIVDIVPGRAQRIVVAGSLGSRIDGFVERHARKAMSIPPRSSGGDQPEATATVRYRIVPEHAKAGAVVPLIAQAEAGEVAIVCRSHDRAGVLEQALTARGVATQGAGSNVRILVLPLTEADQRTTRATVISADVPFDADALVELHGRGGTILATPRERAHLLRIARRAGVTLEPLADPPAALENPAETVRGRVRSILEAGDLAADLALIEPLLDEFPAAEIAAAALQLARSTHQGRQPQVGSAPASQGQAPRAGATAGVGTRPGAGAPPPSTATTWTHLFVSIGSRDEITPGDLVGAMTGEAGIAGDQVGKIDIRESHSTVEVASPMAAQVIQALNGRTIKGRSLRVDYDRKERAPRKSPGDRAGSRGPGRGPSRGGSGRSPSGGAGGGRGGPSRGGSSRGGPSRGGPGRGGSGRGGTGDRPPRRG